ncbi:hypothetical protein H4R35_001749 [Dimargaris xerosporica]|nr:hypothetical protein H4R35_001749 [Dimargaris xerosporica]
MATTEKKPVPLPFHFQFLAGAIAGVSEIVTMYPLDVVKTRFQLQVGTGGAEGYTSIGDCFRKIIKNEGFGRLYRGILPPILVEAPKRATKFAANEQYTQLYLNFFQMEKMNQPLSILTGVSAGVTEAFLVASFELVKIRLQDKNSTKQGELMVNFTAGAIGGTCGTLLNTPMDVVKTRIQNQSAGAVKKYNWAVPALNTIYKEEGFAALYKGFTPKVLRLGPGGGILLVVFDQVSTFIRKHLM